MAHLLTCINEHHSRCQKDKDFFLPSHGYLFVYVGQTLLFFPQGCLYFGFLFCANILMFIRKEIPLIKYHLVLLTLHPSLTSFSLLRVLWTIIIILLPTTLRFSPSHQVKSTLYFFFSPALFRKQTGTAQGSNLAQF